MSSVANKTQGYDATFISEVPEELICVICQLVLRTPVQIMRCGHRYCKACWEAMKDYSKHLNTELICPVDRHPVEIEKVFEDNGAARTVRNLKVRCTNYEHGCNWNGDLGDLEEHGKKCTCNGKDRLANVVPPISDELCKEILSRVKNCEENMAAKEKEMVSVKNTFHKESDKNKKEFKLLKETNQELRLEIESLKQSGEAYRIKMRQVESLIKERDQTKNPSKSNGRNYADMVSKKQGASKEEDSATKERELVVVSALKEDFNKNKEELTELKEMNQVLCCEIQSVKQSSESTDEKIERLIKESDLIAKQMKNYSKELQKISNRKTSESETKRVATDVKDNSLLEFEKEIRATRSHVDKSFDKIDNEIRITKSHIDKSSNKHVAAISKLEKDMNKYALDVGGLRKKHESMVKEIQSQNEALQKLVGGRSAKEDALKKEITDFLTDKIEDETGAIRKHINENAASFFVIGNDMKLFTQETKNRLEQVEKAVEKGLKNKETVITSALEMEFEEYTIKTNGRVDEIEREIRTTRGALEEKFRNDMKEKQNNASNTFILTRIENNVYNLENLLFHDFQGKSVQFKWIAENFGYYSKSGEDLVSPAFSPLVLGYRFDLILGFKDWSDNKLAVSLNLHRGTRGKIYIKNLAPFTNEFKLEIADRKGVGLAHKFNPKWATKNDASCFNIPADMNSAPHTIGQNFLLSPPDDYIINDSIHITLTIFLDSS